MSTDAGVTQDQFSTACPNCGSRDIRPLTQKNNFDHTTQVGAVDIGDGAHVSTSRKYECQKCGHGWDETVPHQE